MALQSSTKRGPTETSGRCCVESFNVLNGDAACSSCCGAVFCAICSTAACMQHVGVC